MFLLLLCHRKAIQKNMRMIKIFMLTLGNNAVMKTIASG